MISQSPFPLLKDRSPRNARVSHQYRKLSCSSKSPSSTVIVIHVVPVSGSMFSWGLGYWSSTGSDSKSQGKSNRFKTASLTSIITTLVGERVLVGAGVSVGTGVLVGTGVSVGAAVTVNVELGIGVMVVAALDASAVNASTIWQAAKTSNTPNLQHYASGVRWCSHQPNERQNRGTHHQPTPQ
jgi:hypothetical protein